MTIHPTLPTTAEILHFRSTYLGQSKFFLPSVKIKIMLLFSEQQQFITYITEETFFYYSRKLDSNSVQWNWFRRATKIPGRGWFCLHTNFTFWYIMKFWDILRFPNFHEEIWSGWTDLWIISKKHLKYFVQHIIVELIFICL